MLESGQGEVRSEEYIVECGCDVGRGFYVEAQVFNIGKKLV